MTDPSKTPPKRPRRAAKVKGSGAIARGKGARAVRFRCDVLAGRVRS